MANDGFKSMDGVVYGDEESRLIVEFLEANGFESTKTNVYQMRVYMKAMYIFAERNERYKDLWKKSGWFGNIFHIHHKALRLFRNFIREGGEGEPSLDDAYDLINYAAFAIRCLELKNKWGD